MKQFSRNPCFNGIWFLINIKALCDALAARVAILVLMEYGF